MARQKAVELSDKLQTGDVDGIDVTWAAFCLRYEEEHLSLGASKSVAAWKTACAWYTNLMNPQFLQDVSASTISRFTARLRTELEVKNGSCPETTVASYLRQIRAAVNWAELIGLLATRVRVQIPRRARGHSKLARRRPIVLEEFERLLAAVPKVRPSDTAQWDWFLRGLWESGLRIGAVAAMSWDREAQVAIDEVSCRHPVVRMSPEADSGLKTTKDRLQPITPEFWDLVTRVPIPERVGLVFPVVNAAGKQYTTEWIGRIVSRIGSRAGVRTGAKDGEHATAHDLRRGFVTSLGAVLSQNELAEWMGHDSADTTKNYYYAPTVDALAEKLWAARKSK